jgi:8-oxo-dGTP diphosphatase
MSTYCYEYPRPAVTVDIVLFRRERGGLEVLVIQRASDPYKGKWAFPGGYVNDMEPLERAAARELEEETGISGIELEQVGAFGDPGRDPRGHTISVAFAGFVGHAVEARAADDAEDARWLPVHEARGLAFDHDQMLERALGAMGFAGGQRQKS